MKLSRARLLMRPLQKRGDVKMLVRIPLSAETIGFLKPERLPLEQ